MYRLTTNLESTCGDRDARAIDCENCRDTRLMVLVLVVVVSRHRVVDE